MLSHRGSPLANTYREMRAKHSIYLVSAGFMLAGCGGGSGSSSAPISTATPFAAGELQGMAAISNPPVTTSSAFSVATALSGSFTILKLKELNPSLAETRIFYKEDLPGQKAKIVSSAIDGSDLQILPGTGDWDIQPYVLPSGKILFSSHLTGRYQIYSMNADGSNVTQLTNATNTDCGHVSADAAGDKISYIANGQAFVVDLKTNVTTPIPLVLVGDTVYYAVLTPDGNQIFFASENGATDRVNVAQLNPLVGSQSFLSLPGFPEGMAMAPDGSEFVVATSGTPSYLDRISTTILSDVKVSVPAPGGYVGVTYSPDMKEFAYGYYPPGMPYRVATIPLNGGSSIDITPQLVNNQDPTWGPFTKDRTLIASGGGLLGTHACGVIYGQQLNHTTSVIAFDATTPSSVVMTAQTPPNGTQPNLVFSIDADNITKLAYANGYAWRGIRAIGSGTTVTAANGAIVSLNALDGTVVSILPFSGTRAAGDNPTFTDSGTMRTFTGHFLAAFDKDGKNLAPNGASSVKLDVKSGSISVEP